jgi:GTP-binding protein
MKIKSAEFETSAPDLGSSPKWALPEFAFIGRSNVGKSSLVNMLTERRELAKVSDTPGKTQLINFFVVNGNWCLVDLPGYGYAHVGKERRQEFNYAVADFLSGRPNLRRVFVLIDSRLPPQPIDIEFLRWLEREGVPFALIFTKTDKQSASKGQASMDAFRKAMGEWRSDLPQIFASSSKSRDGRAEILGCINDILSNSQVQAG